jgi:hypothetical protein
MLKYKEKYENGEKEYDFWVPEFTEGA